MDDTLHQLKAELAASGQDPAAATEQADAQQLALSSRGNLGILAHPKPENLFHLLPTLP